jgi:hypothetical protein
MFPNQRTFGVVSNSYTSAPAVDTSELFNKLSACGINVPDRDRKQVDFNSNIADQGAAAQATAAAVQLNNDHITTVICLCGAATSTTVMNAATGQHYQPEWVVSSFGLNDYEPLGRDQPEAQWTHAIGVSFWNKWQPLVNSPCYWAETAANPQYNYTQKAFSEIGCQQDYNVLLVLAAGIQMAGPILTPQTFAAGLAKTHFPNPPSPFYEGRVGFETDHTMVDDAALIWYDSKTPGPYSYNAATWCYVRHGTRVALGGYNLFSAMFQQETCDP